MTATTGYQAGVESNDVQISYGIEATWGTAPSTTFQAIRMISESLLGAKERGRPSEINPTFEASQAVTTRESAGGSIQGAVSFGTYDELWSVAMGADWQALQTINGVAGDITVTNVSSTSATLSSTTTNKFQNIAAGQWIRLLGFTNAANNGFHYVSAKATNQSITLTTLVATVTETPAGTAAKVRASTLLNGSQFKSLHLQKKLASNLWFRYPGCFIPGFTIGSQLGGFTTCSFNVAAQSVASATSDASTGGVIAAPTGPVQDCVAGFGGLLFNEVAVGAGVTAFNLTANRQGSAANYAMGSSSAAGMSRGVFEASATVTLYFKSFTEFARFKAETLGRYTIITQDAAGQAYLFTFRNAALMSPNISAGGPGSDVMATFTIEGNPQSTGGTLQIDRLVAA